MYKSGRIDVDCQIVLAISRLEIRHLLIWELLIYIQYFDKIRNLIQPSHPFEEIDI